MINYSRRSFFKLPLPLVCGLSAISSLRADLDQLKIRYILSSAMYGEMKLDDILPEVSKAGCEAIDIWCKVHGNQREQISEMGYTRAKELFDQYKVKPAVFTRYPLGPFGLQKEIKTVSEFFDSEIFVCGTTGSPELKGAEAKKAVQSFLEKMKPHLATAEERGVIIAVENHSSQFLYHPDALRYFAEFNKSAHLGVAFAPHHLHKFTDEIPDLIRDLGSQNIPFMYFQEHSVGMLKKYPKKIEMQQMPGFGGTLNYKNILTALKDIKYEGYCEIFMHPVPRGIPILPEKSQVTNAIIKSKNYIDSLID